MKNEYQKLYDAACKKAERAMLARSSLPIGSSRARVTTANARWMAACEYRDLCEEKMLKWEEENR